MTLAELKKVDAGTKGINVKGKISGVWPAKNGPYGKTQFFLLSDGTETIGVQAKEVTLTDADKGTEIEIIGGTWRSYESKGKTNFILEIPKSRTSELKMGVKSAVTTSSPVVAEDSEDLKLHIFNEYKEAMVSALELLNDDVISKMLAACKEKGWDTVNVTAVAASLWIELNKTKHIAQMRR